MNLVSSLLITMLSCSTDVWIDEGAPLEVLTHNVGIEVLMVINVCTFNQGSVEQAFTSDSL